MAAISLIDPYSQQAEEIARRQRMARALQESEVLDYKPKSIYQVFYLVICCCHCGNSH